MACSAISRPELRNILQQRVACKIAISEEQKCGLLSAGVLLCLSNVSDRLQEATVENFECVLKLFQSEEASCYLCTMILLVILMGGCWTVSAVHVGSAVAQVSPAICWQILVSDGDHCRDWDRLPDCAGDDQPLPGRVQAVRLTWTAQRRGGPAARARSRRLLGRLQHASLF